MNEGYFSHSFRAIRLTPHWVRKLLLLSLVVLIPIFGPIAVAGYIVGWARDAAWGVENPMPEHIFGNEDQRQYSRGFFTIIIEIAFAIIPALLVGLASVVFAFSAASPFFAADHFHVGAFVALTTIVINIMIDLFSTVVSCAVSVLAMVGVLRMAIYGKFTAGFQFRHIFVMAKHDPRGLLKIFGIYFTGIVSITVVGSIYAAIMLIFSVPGILGVIYGAYASSAALIPGSIMLVTIIVLGIFGFAAICLTGSIFLMLLTYRAMGYWVSQFDVLHWRGQDDLLPFEMVEHYEGR